MQTSTAKNACAVVVYIEGEDGVLVDVSGSMNGFEIAFSQDLGEFSVFGGAWKQRLTCKKDARATLKIVYTTATREAWKLFKDWWQNTPSDKRTIRLMVPTEEIGADAVHLVDVAQTWHAVVAGVAPVGLRLWFYARYATEGGDKTIQHAHAALHFDVKIDVPRGINQIDVVSLAVFGLVIQCRGLSFNGDSTFALDIH